MDTTVGTPLYSSYVLLLVVLAVVAASLSVRAVRHRSEPGSGPFAAMMASQTVWLLSYAVALVTFYPVLRECCSRSPAGDGVKYLTSRVQPVG